MNELLHKRAPPCAGAWPGERLTLAHSLSSLSGQAMKRRALLRHIALGAGTLALPALAQSERRIVLGQYAALSGPAAQLGL